MTSQITSTEAEVSRLLKLLEDRLRTLEAWDPECRGVIEAAVNGAIKPAEFGGVVTTDADVVQLTNQIKDLFDFVEAKDFDYALLISDLREGGPLMKALRACFSYTDEQVTGILNDPKPAQYPGSR